MRVVSDVASELPLSRSVGVDDVKRCAAMSRALEHQLASVGRPRRVDVQERRLGGLRGCAGRDEQCAEDGPDDHRWHASTIAPYLRCGIVNPCEACLRGDQCYMAAT